MNYWLVKQEPESYSFSDFQKEGKTDWTGVRNYTARNNLKEMKVGDKVMTGQVLGLLGNSGNTDTPHLHFHVMDGPSPLVSNGLPYVFTSFTGQGMLKDEKPLFTGGQVDVEESTLAGPHKNQLPLNDQVLSFP